MGEHRLESNPALALFKLLRKAEEHGRAAQQERASKALKLASAAANDQALAYAVARIYRLSEEACDRLASFSSAREMRMGVGRLQVGLVTHLTEPWAKFWQQVRGEDLLSRLSLGADLIDTIERDDPALVVVDPESLAAHVDDLIGLVARSDLERQLRSEVLQLLHELHRVLEQPSLETTSTIMLIVDAFVTKLSNERVAERLMGTPAGRAVATLAVGLSMAGGTIAGYVFANDGSQAEIPAVVRETCESRVIVELNQLSPPAPKELPPAGVSPGGGDDPEQTPGS